MLDERFAELGRAGVLNRQSWGVGHDGDRFVGRADLQLDVDTGDCSDLHADALLHELRKSGRRGFEVIDSGGKPDQSVSAGGRADGLKSSALVIAGYTSAARNFEALIIGYYEDGKLIYTARTTLLFSLKPSSPVSAATERRTSGTAESFLVEMFTRGLLGVNGIIREEFKFGKVK